MTNEIVLKSKPFAPQSNLSHFLSKTIAAAMVRTGKTYKRASNWHTEQ